jgi:hypothetical protein
MNLHNIHGNNVSFHVNAIQNKNFLKYGLQRQHAQGYFKTAQQKGKAFFIDPSGQKFAIEHNKADNSFSVKKSFSRF